MSLVVDASVLVDIFAPKEEARRKLAVELLRLARGKPKYAPKMLISNDRTQVENARRAGIRAYLLVEERDMVFKKLKSP
ncbi:hypothetical protein DRO32_02585 [Candidatus Bathyarchaeota archaeon]|nr:MAG: hypothetical protein DRO32_02585 [Candidatus Bathyarchaeota archaeon]